MSNPGDSTTPFVPETLREAHIYARGKNDGILEYAITVRERASWKIHDIERMSQSVPLTAPGTQPVYGGPM